jgi:hypothetical protein
VGAITRRCALSSVCAVDGRRSARTKRNAHSCAQARTRRPPAALRMQLRTEPTEQACTDARAAAAEGRAAQQSTCVILNRES